MSITYFGVMNLIELPEYPEINIEPPVFVTSRKKVRATLQATQLGASSAHRDYSSYLRIVGDRKNQENLFLESREMNA